MEGGSAEHDAALEPSGEEYEGQDGPRQAGDVCDWWQGRGIERGILAASAGWFRRGRGAAGEGANGAAWLR